MPIITSPNALTPVVNGFGWILTLADLGTPPVKKWLGYELLDSSGNIQVKRNSVRPGSTSDPIFAFFERDIQGLMKPLLPAISALGVQNDTSIIKEFKLRYGESSINTDTGVTTDNVTTETALYKVFGGANNIFDAAMITAPGVHILSDRPLTYNILRESLDYIWVLGSTTIQYLVRYFDGTTQNIVQSAPYDANIVPIGLPFLTALLTGGHTNDDVAELEISIGSTVYNVGFENVCEESIDFIEVLFWEPKGGRGIMVFQTIEGVGTQSNRTLAHVYGTVNSIATLRTDGRQVTGSETDGTFSFKRQIGDDPNERRWAMSFGAASQWHLLLKDRSGARFWAEFILDGQPNINIETKEMTASGILSRPFYAPISR